MRSAHRHQMYRSPGMQRKVAFLALLAATMVPAPRAAWSAGNAEEQCQSGRYAAAAGYSACEQKALAKGYNVSADVASDLLARCASKYRKIWPKLQNKATGTGSTCDQERFTDNGNTITDWLTGLEWEKKNVVSAVHGVGQMFTWASGIPPESASGTVFTTFLNTTNYVGSGFGGGHKDWRLPTIHELQTIAIDAPCADCIDPVFFPYADEVYWTTTQTGHASNSYFWSPERTWILYFGGYATPGTWLKGAFGTVRAVRGGL